MREGQVTAEFANELLNWSLQDRIDAGDAIEPLVGSPGLETIAKVLDAAREATWQRTVRSTKDAEQLGKLNRSLGFIDGLDALPDLIATIRASAQGARKEREEAAQRADQERQARA